MGDKKDKLLIAAIDFGTTFSGYAFSFKHDYKTDPLKISTNQNWVAGSRGLVSLKAPTCVLLSPQKEFIAFGYEAEDLYSELALDENHYDHYFFKRFKMVLHESRVSTTPRKVNLFCPFDTIVLSIPVRISFLEFCKCAVSKMLKSMAFDIHVTYTNCLIFSFCSYAL